MHVYVHGCVGACVHVCAFTCACIHVCVRACKYASVRICTLCVCVYVHAYLCLCVCVCVNGLPVHVGVMSSDLIPVLFHKFEPMNFSLMNVTVLMS